MCRVFVTSLGTDNFLVGVLALHQSLKVHNPYRELVVLVTENVSSKSLEILDRKKILLKKVNEVQNLNNVGEDERGFSYTYTKLRVFELLEYEKIVYIDSDMLVCADVEQLFDKPHMSAVCAGSLMPDNLCWMNLYSGLMVIQPSIDLAKK